MRKKLIEITKSVFITLGILGIFYGYVELGFWVGQNIMSEGQALALFMGLPLFSMIVFCVHLARDPR